MKFIHVATISTTTIIVLGIILISPVFFRTPTPEIQKKVMLSFSVVESANVSEWCQNLSSILKKYDVSATVFFVGKVAEKNQDSITYFSNKIDIGSQTYSNVDLASISDYSVQLEEVKKGKMVIDETGKLYSRSFKAPYGTTDQNIYSLLSRSDIIGDFSYENHYNLFVNEQFIRYDAAVYDGISYSPEFFLKLPKAVQPIIITFESPCSLIYIESLISQLQTGNITFVNASDISGYNLTVRGEG